jgi:outer membrane receptor for Fe3+-dicitrate
VGDQPSFVIFPDTTRPLNVNEDRYFNTFGAQANFSWEQSEAVTWKTGILGSYTTGHENFSTFDSAGTPGPSSIAPLNGSDVGAYAQVVYSPVEWFQLRTGARYDWHTAPFAGTQRQLSPRIRLNFFPDPTNTFFLYYGRQFLPTNIEDLRAITYVSAGGDTLSNSPTLPERDDFYSGGYIHRFTGGVVVKLSGYFKQSSPGIDDNTVPGTAIVTSVNLTKVRVTGVETVIEVRPTGPLSGYLNFAIAHAYGRGPITGGFFPTDTSAPPGGWFDLDHDARVAIVANAVYSPTRWYLSATGIYGSGLTNGADITQPIGLGLTDFNSSIHVKANFVLNAATGYSFIVGKSVLRPQVFVDNVFNYHYLLKGAFFSGASVGRPRTVQVQLSVGY